MVTSVGAGSSRRALLVGASTTVVCSLPVFFTATMTVQLTEELGFGTVGIGAAVGSFFGTMAVTSLHLGRVADRLGATLSLRFAATGAVVSTLGVATLARDWLTLVVWLVIAGLAAALGQPAANRLLVNRVSPARLGTAFGLKQSAPPLASMLAGLSVPAIALTVGWRWAFVLAAGCALMVVVGVGPRPASAPPRIKRADRIAREPLRDPATIVVLAGGFGLSFATSSVVLAYYVDAAVRSGSSPSTAGVVFAAASLMAVLTRLSSGIACDRLTIAPLRLCAGLLTAGSGGLALLASGNETLMLFGVLLALAGTWGFPGVFWFALVRAYPETPGRITGTMAPAAIGGIVGPIGFGWTATTISYSLAWGLTSGVALLAAGAMLFGAARLAAADPNG